MSRGRFCSFPRAPPTGDLRRSAQAWEGTCPSARGLRDGFYSHWEEVAPSKVPRGTGVSVVTTGMRRPQHHSISTSCIASHGNCPRPCPRPLQRALLAQLTMMLVCLYQDHVSVVSQPVTPQIKSRPSTCFFKEQENPPLGSASCSLSIFK